MKVKIFEEAGTILKVRLLEERVEESIDKSKRTHEYQLEVIEDMGSSPIHTFPVGYRFRAVKTQGYGGWDLFDIRDVNE